MVCVQAKLNHFNQDQNLLTAWFANEYSMHFELITPGDGCSGAPIPWAARPTTSSPRAARPRCLGPKFSDRDADLGIRLHREGYRTAMIDSTTLEEANSQVPNWIRQRSRWNKGYIQTWLVHMRHPMQLLAATGMRDFPQVQPDHAHGVRAVAEPDLLGPDDAVRLHPGRFHRAAVPGIIFYVASALLFIGNFRLRLLSTSPAASSVVSFPDPDGTDLAALLGPDELGGLEGLHPAVHEPVLLEKTTHGLDDGSASS